MSRHVLSLLVEDKPGLLTRVAGLFARRGFNIEGHALEQVTKQLNKLINVIKVVELEPEQAVQRDHILVKVKTDATNRSQVLEAADLFRARVIDVVSDTLIIEITGDSSKCQAFIKVLEPFGVKELVQSGILAMGRGSKSISDNVSR
jgi:acetolactate synthase I/III small subunit